MTIEARRMTYSVDEAAAILGVSKSKIYDSVRIGELRSVQVGRRVVIPRDALEALLGIDSAGGSSRAGSAQSDSGASRHTLTELNIVCVTGRLARPPELRLARTGMALCTLRVAIPRRRQDGQPRGPLHVDVVAFGTVAEASAQHGEGEDVTITGRLNQRVWTSSDGGRRTRIEIVADAVRATQRPESGEAR